MDYKLIVSSDTGEIDFYSDPNIRLISSDGLGFASDITTTKIYGYDGTKFAGNSLQQRAVSIAARIRSAGRESAEVAKKRLYAVLARKKAVKIKYAAPNTDVYIMGYVEQVNAPPNNHPLTAQISIICPEPYWIDARDNTVSIAGMDDTFEFPIEIPSDGMEFGRIKSSLIAIIENVGTADSGAVFTITAKTVCTNPKITNIDTGEYMQVNVSMAAGDIISICTKQGKKSIFFTHNDVVSNYFNYRSRGSSFFQIRCGTNRIKYTVDSGDEHSIDVTCSFDIKYGGV